MMQPIFRSLVAILTVLVLVAASWQPTFACSCIMPPPPLDALASSDAVFSGRVTGQFDANLGPMVSSADPVRYTFEVKQVWKGAANPSIVVSSARDGASCGYTFEQGREYLVYANTLEGGLETSLCSRTAQLAQAQDDLAALGEGQTVAPAAAESPSIMPWIVGGVIAVLIVAVVVFGAGLVMFQKREP